MLGMILFRSRNDYSLDEPTSKVDRVNREDDPKLDQRLTVAQHKTVITVTHDLRVGGNMLVLRRVVEFKNRSIDSSKESYYLKGIFLEQDMKQVIRK